MAQIFSKWTNRVPIAIVAGLPIVAIAVIAGIWYYFSPEFLEVGYTPTQPVPFSHQLHAGQLGMDCRYCHSTVEKSQFAAVPPTETCMGCHKIILPESPKLAPVRESFATGKPIPWVNVHMLPEYAKFPHNAHVAAGVGCVSCHGRVDQMKVVRQVSPLSMSWCLECHRNPHPNLRPRDQVTNMTWDPKAAKYDPVNDPKRVRDVSPPQNCSACHY